MQLLNAREVSVQVAALQLVSSYIHNYIYIAKYL